jgi:uncharacterized protein
MSLMARMVAAQMGFPPAKTRDVVVERGLRIPMPDGVELGADRHSPQGVSRAPVMLLRCPYGRTPSWTAIATALAEQGYQVLLQSTRGTYDSGGNFEPGAAEAADGQATIDWLRRQPWFPGTFVTYGQSYLGYAQWALASADLPEWKAAAIGVAPSDWYSGYTHPGGVFSLARTLNWIDGQDPQISGHASVPKLFWRAVTRPWRLRPVEAHLPVADADRLALGHEVDYYQRWVASDGHDDYAAQVDFRKGVDHLPPVHLTAGWYDFFLPTMLTDYAALRRVGRPVRLLIGPWRHEAGSTKQAARELFPWLAYYGQGADVTLPDEPVRVHVMGDGRWVELADWPPPESAPTSWYLQAGGRLISELALDQPAATIAPPTRYRYDPADPTPNVGGAFPDLPWRYGPKDNRKLEARPDVLTFTTEVLDRDLEIIGPVEAQLFVRSSLAHTDFFARLCDVWPNGRSTNLCDGIVRLRPGEPNSDGDGIRRVRISMAGTAYRFRPGHRIRLQVSSGAHPLYARNLGTGEPPTTATTMRAADQEVFHDAEHRSAVVLPLV